MLCLCLACAGHYPLDKGCAGRQLKQAPRKREAVVGSWSQMLTSSLILPLESEMIAVAYTYPWSLFWGCLATSEWVQRKKLLCWAHPSPPTPAQQYCPPSLLGLLSHHTLAPSGYLHAANPSPLPWVWPPKLKPLTTSVMSTSSWGVLGSADCASLSGLASVNQLLCSPLRLQSSLCPCGSACQLMDFPSCRKIFPSQLPPKDTCPILIPPPPLSFFLF